jgi:flavin-binding protein dodecin
MATMKVIEVMSESTESWEDATQSGVSDVCKSVNGVNSVWVKDQSAVVEDGKITKYRVKLKVSFSVQR